MALCVTLGKDRRILADWRSDSTLTAHGRARQYARQHGYAGVLLADGRYRSYSFCDAKGTIVQRTYTDARVLYL